MRYAASRTASIETHRATRARADSFGLPATVADKAEARSTTSHATRAMGAHRVARHFLGIRLETNWMTTRLNSAENQPAPRNGSKYGRI